MTSTKSTRPTVHRAGVAIAGGAVLVTSLATMAASEAPTAQAAYHTPWSRQNAYDHGITGINEGYEFGKSKWNTNDIQESWPTEGADCSGYVGKIWAAPAYTAIGTNYSYPWSGAWAAEQVDGSVKISLTDSRTRKMDAWAWQGHMGVFEGTKDSAGKWKVWHAASEASGISTAYKADSYFTSNSAKRFKRANW